MKLLVLRCWWLGLIALTFTACFSPQFQDGKIACGPNDECPPGLDCVAGVCRSSNAPLPDADPNSATLTVTKTGNGSGSVSSNPAGINCGSDCTESMPAGSTVTLTASAATGSLFVGWTGACSGMDTCTVTLDADKTATANFVLQNTLMVALAGNGMGIVSSNPPGISCGTDCMEQYAPNTMVTLTASAATGSDFEGWSGGGCSGLGTCVVTLDSAKMVTATFTLSLVTLTVDIDDGNGGGTVTSVPAGINCGVDCTEQYDYNQMVTLTAAPMTG